MEGILSSPVSCSLSTYWYFAVGVSVNTCICKVALEMTYQSPNFYVEFIAWAESISLWLSRAAALVRKIGVTEVARAFLALQVLRIL